MWAILSVLAKWPPIESATFKIKLRTRKHDSTEDDDNSETSWRFVCEQVNILCTELILRRTDHESPFFSSKFQETLPKKKSFLTSLAAIYHRKKLSCLVYPRYKFRTEIPEYCPKNLPFSHARSILGRPCQTPRNRSNQHSQKKSEISYCAHLIIT